MFPAIGADRITRACPLLGSLLCRVIYVHTIEANWALFLVALHQFWTNLPGEWLVWDRSFDGAAKRLEDRVCERRRSATQVDTWKNPPILRGIPYIIDQSLHRPYQLCPASHNRSRPPPRIATKIPLDIALAIMDVVYGNGEDYYHLMDTHYLLSAFKWKLPESWWQKRCRRDLFFEVDDLVKNKTAVDWQSLCLGLNKLSIKQGRGSASGLVNRGRILGFSHGINDIFLKKVEKKKKKKQGPQALYS